MRVWSDSDNGGEIEIEKLLRRMENSVLYIIIQFKICTHFTDGMGPAVMQPVPLVTVDLNDGKVGPSFSFMGFFSLSEDQGSWCGTLSDFASPESLLF